jgi:hypothetical protein
MSNPSLVIMATPHEDDRRDFRPNILVQEHHRRVPSDSPFWSIETGRLLQQLVTTEQGLTQSAAE